MSLVYKYVDRNTDRVIYVGMVGTHGREDVDGLIKRDQEHWTNKYDPVFRSSYQPNEVDLYCTNLLTEADARAVEWISIAHYKPELNRRPSGQNLSGSFLFLDLGLKWNKVKNKWKEKKENSIHGKGNGKTKKEAIEYKDYEEIRRYFELAEYEMKWRDYCIVSILCKIGIRLSDIVNMKRSDYDGKKIFISRIQRWVDIDDELDGLLRRWNEERSLYRVKKDSEECMFISGQKRGISEKTVQWLIKKVGVAIGKEDISVASLREYAKIHLENDLTSRRSQNIIH